MEFECPIKELPEKLFYKNENIFKYVFCDGFFEFSDHVMFDNSDKTFVLMNQNQGNNALMMYYANQTDDGAIIDSVRNGSDLAFLANNPGIIRIDGDPTTPNGPTIAYIGNDNEDFIEIKKINSSEIVKNPAKINYPSRIPKKNHSSYIQ